MEKTEMKTDGIVLTLDEAIEHCKENAQKETQNGNLQCAIEHNQLAIWLSQVEESKAKAAAYDRLMSGGKKTLKESEIKWIPVSEKLPSHHLPVLVKDQYTPVNANYAVAYHNGFEWLPDIEAINIIGDAYTELCSQPTHWCEIKGKGEIS